MEEYKHNLANEFPDHEERINYLKAENNDFKTLAREYHALDHRIAGLNASGIPASDNYYESLKLRRVQLKDKLFGFICDDTDA